MAARRPPRWHAGAGPDPKIAWLMDAAFNTGELVDRLLMVTKDGTYQ